MTTPPDATGAILQVGDTLTTDAQKAQVPVGAKVMLRWIKGVAAFDDPCIVQNRYVPNCLNANSQCLLSESGMVWYGNGGDWTILELPARREA